MLKKKPKTNKQERLDTSSLLYGRIYKTEMKSNVTIKRSDFNLPRVEPQYSFLMNADLNEKVDLATVQGVIEEMRNSIEVTDSRYVLQLGNSTNKLGDYIADNARSGILFLGDKINWIEHDLESAEPVIYIGKEEEQVAYHTKELSPIKVLCRFINHAVTTKLPIKQ